MLKGTRKGTNNFKIYFMQSFQFTEPYIYPDLEKVKDKKGNPINSNGQIIKKWCIRYKITFANGEVDHRKEYGKSYLKVHNGKPLNRITDLQKKIFEANVLLGLVKDDLSKGIDPEKRDEEVRKATLKAIEDAKRFKYRYVFDLWFASKNYVNPIPSKVISAKNLKAFHLNQFLPYLESKCVDGDIRLVTDDLINDFIKTNYDSSLWSAFTASQRVGWLSGVFTFAYKKKLISTNPIEFVEKIVEDKVIINKEGVATLKVRKQNRYNKFSGDELKRIFDYVHDTKDEAIFKTLHFAFIRFSEIFRLKISHLDLDNSQFVIPSHIAKGQRDGETAYVPIFPELKECLERYLRNQFKGDLNPSYPLFPLDEDITKEDVYNNFYTRYMTVVRALNKDENYPVKIEKTPYALKHTGAQTFIDQNKAANVSPFEILEGLKNLMRHKDFATTQKYLKKDLGVDLDVKSRLVFGKSL